MIRRGTSRTPPYILAVLILIIVLLGFNYWTLSSQNSDLSQEIEKLQSEIKISAVKQDQSEKKNAALQETVHEMDSLSSRLNKEIQSDKESLKSSNKEAQSLRYEITTLKNKIAKMDEQISSLNQQSEECELDLSKAKETNTHLQTERDDAVEAIAEKDSNINSLKRQLEQVTLKRSQLTMSLATCNSELISLKKECEEVERASDSLADIIIQTKRDAQLESETKLGLLKEQLAEEKNKNNMMQFSVDDLQKKVSQTFSDLTEAQDRVSQLETALQKLDSEKQKERSKRDVLNVSMKDLNAQLTKASSDLMDCKTNLEALGNVEEELKKAQDEAAAARREKMAVAKPKMERGMMNLPGIEQKEPYVGPGQLDYISRRAVNTRDLGMQGINFHREVPILPRDPPNAPRKKPRFSVADITRDVAAHQKNDALDNVNVAGVLAAPQPVVQGNGDSGNDQKLQVPGAPPVMERPAPPNVVNNKPIQAPVLPGAVEGPVPQNDVLAPPPQHLQAPMDSKEKDLSKGKRDDNAKDSEKEPDENVDMRNEKPENLIDGKEEEMAAEDAAKEVMEDVGAKPDGENDDVNVEDEEEKEKLD